MATLFPLNPQVNDLYQGYYWDGNFWKRSGQDAGFGYLEEATLQATYATQADLDNIDLSLYLTQSSASTQFEKNIPYSSASPNGAITGDMWIDSYGTSPLLKTYNGSVWVQLGSSDDVFVRLNLQTVDENYTMPVGYNGVTAGPITIADGVTFTVPDGSAWSVV